MHRALARVTMSFGIILDDRRCNTYVLFGKPRDGACGCSKADARGARRRRQGKYIPKAASVARAAVQAGRASTPAALRRVAAPPLCSAPIYTRSRRGPKVGSFSFSQRPLSGAQHGLTIPSVCPCPVDLATNLRAWQKKRSLTRPRSGRRSSGRRSELPQVYSSLTVSTRPVPRRRLQAGQPLPPRP